MKKFLILSLIVSITSFALANDNAEKLFDKKCLSCHIKTRPQNMSKLVAPPIMGVMRHVKMAYPKKEDGIKFITDYVLNPDIKKALCMPGRIKRFGLMPSLKGQVTKEEIAKIASWLYDNFPPKNFRPKEHSGAFKHWMQNPKR